MLENSNSDQGRFLQGKEEYFTMSSESTSYFGKSCDHGKYIVKSHLIGFSCDSSIST